MLITFRRLEKILPVMQIKNEFLLAMRKNLRGKIRRWDYKEPRYGKKSVAWLHDCKSLENPMVSVPLKVSAKYHNMPRMERWASANKNEIADVTRPYRTREVAKFYIGLKG